MSAGGAHKEDLQRGGSRLAGRVHIPGVRKVTSLIIINIVNTIFLYFCIISSVNDLVTVPVRPRIALFLLSPTCSPIDTSEREF